MELSIKKWHKWLAFETWYTIAAQKGCVIVWMSIGNSYFNKKSIQEIIDFTKSNFHKIKFLIPYKPAIYTYKAIGYDEEKAITKARLWSNRLKNHIHNNIVKEINTSNIDIVNREEVIDNDSYKENSKYLQNLYKKNEDFFHDVNNSTEAILKGRIKEWVNIEEWIKIWINYLLEELAFILASPQIFNVEETAYIYHKRRPIFEKLIHGEYDGIVRFNNGFILLN